MPLFIRASVGSQKRCEDASHSKALACETNQSAFLRLAKLSECARVLAPLSLDVRITFIMASLSSIVSYTDRFLRIRDVGDWDNALNGLQIENSGRVTRIGAAVDVSTRVLTEAQKQDIDLLIVHHGLFWPGLQPIQGALRRQLRLAFENNVALYSAHLPLDIHPRLGNNAQLVAALGLKSAQPFLEEKGQPVGLKIPASLSRSELVRKLQKALNGPVKVFGFGPKRTRAIGVVTGAAGSAIYRVADEGIDKFITGEAPHWAAVAAEELGVNLLFGGHYATEVFGVKALAAHLSKRFRVPWEFIDFPTGLGGESGMSIAECASFPMRLML